MRPTAPTPDALLHGQATSYWLKDALRTALARDPVDVLADAEALHAVLQQRLEALLPRQRGATAVCDGGPCLAIQVGQVYEFHMLGADARVGSPSPATSRLGRYVGLVVRSHPQVPFLEVEDAHTGLRELLPLPTIQTISHVAL